MEGRASGCSPGPKRGRERLQKSGCGRAGAPSLGSCDTDNLVSRSGSPRRRVNPSKEGNVELKWPTWIGVVAEGLEQQRRFYRDTLGFRETESSGSWVEFEIPGGGLFEVIQRDPSPQYDTKRYQVGFTVADIQAAREELVRRGVTTLSEIEGVESETRNLWCYFRDPEGNVFEITEWLEGRDAGISSRGAT
jgi:catechol 2,3-dioxygenase-like lactoylglutathione lyase family enzyme